MNKRELEQCKKLLLKEREKVLGEIASITKDALGKSQRDASGDLSGYTFHMADAATDSYDRQFSLNIASNGQNILYEIDEALKRIDDKTYGKCQECGKKIDKQRLAAIPYTSMCIDCQGKKEKK